MMNEALFRKMFMGEQLKNYTVNCKIFAMSDYEQMDYTDVPQAMSYTDELSNGSAYRGFTDRPSYQNILEDYTRKETKIKATLLILQIPVLIMLAAFLFMISAQMYEMEKTRSQ